MDDKRHLTKIGFCLIKRRNHAKCLIVERAGDLRQTHLATFLIQPDEVGKSTTNINANQIAFDFCSAFAHLPDLPRHVPRHNEHAPSSHKLFVYE